MKTLSDDTPRNRDPILAPAILCTLVAAAVSMLGTWRLDTHSMEGIIALGGERMVATGEWFVPRLYGTVYAYKPALAYWLAGLSQHFLGHCEFAMRLPTALCAVAMCLSTFWILARLATPRCGLYAALAMCFSALFVEHARIADYDIPLSLGTGIATLAATRNLVLRQSALAWWITAYLGLAFAFLAKGMPAFGMFGPGLLVAALLLRQIRQFVTWQHLAGAAVGALVIGVYLYLAWREAGRAAFADQGSEVGFRSMLWTWKSVVQSLAKPIIIWAVFLPGSAMVPALPFLWRRYRTRMPVRFRRLTLALAGFFLAGVVVWMAIPTESSRYYLPLIASIAGLAGIAAEALSPNRFRRNARHLGGERLSAPYRAEADAELSPPSQGGAKGGSKRRSTARALWHTYQPGAAIAIAGLIYSLVYAGWHQPAKVATRSERAVAAAFADHLAPQQTVYFDGFDTGSSLFYYLQHPVGRWESSAPVIDDGFTLAITHKKAIDDRSGRQRSLLMNRPDVRVEILETVETGEGRTWELARVARIP